MKYFQGLREIAKKIYSNILLIASILASLAGFFLFIFLFLPDFNIYWLILSPIIVAFYQVPAVYFYWLWKKKKKEKGEERREE